MGCVLCGSDIIETALHLFINCPMAAQIWRALSAKVNMPMISLRESVLDTYLASTPRGAGSQVEHWLTYFISTVWAIWRERNNRIFRQQHTLVPLIVENICMEGRLSLKYCSQRLLFGWISVCFRLIVIWHNYKKFFIYFIFN
jgi:hypothetical protein